MRKKGIHLNVNILSITIADWCTGTHLLEINPWSPGGSYGPENGYNFPCPRLLRVKEVGNTCSQADTFTVMRLYSSRPFKCLNKASHFTARWES